MVPKGGITFSGGVVVSIGAVVGTGSGAIIVLDGSPDSDRCLYFSACAYCFRCLKRRMTFRKHFSCCSTSALSGRRNQRSPPSTPAATSIATIGQRERDGPHVWREERNERGKKKGKKQFVPLTAPLYFLPLSSGPAPGKGGKGGGESSSSADLCKDHQELQSLLEALVVIPPLSPSLNHCTLLLPLSPNLTMPPCARSARDMTAARATERRQVMI